MPSPHPSSTGRACDPGLLTPGSRRTRVAGAVTYAVVSTRITHTRLFAATTTDVGIPARTTYKTSGRNQRSSSAGARRSRRAEC